jgi:Spx/MgsR family transcriptional regulator
MALVLYGIPNCDTVKKARAWLAAQGIEHAFHDFRKQGVPAERLDAWLAALGWQALVNRRGTTWRKLDPALQAAVTDAASARALLLAQASVIRRPVIERDGEVLGAGFDAPLQAQLAGLPRG